MLCGFAAHRSKCNIVQPSTTRCVGVRSASLQMQLDGLRNSFEYISDYVNIYGLKIWQARPPMRFIEAIRSGPFPLRPIPT